MTKENIFLNTFFFKSDLIKLLHDIENTYAIF